VLFGERRTVNECGSVRACRPCGAQERQVGESSSVVMETACRSPAEERPYKMPEGPDGR